MAKNFANIMNANNLSRKQKTPSRKNTRKTTFRYIIVKLLKIEDKIFRAARAQRNFQENTHLASMGAKRQTNNVIKIMKQSNACQTRVPQKLEEMKNILRQITLRKFIVPQVGGKQSSWEQSGIKGKRELERELI